MIWAKEDAMPKSLGAYDGFRVQDLASLLDTNPRRIEGWVEQGFLKPAHPGRGTGRPHRFTLENLTMAYVLTELQQIHGDKSPVLGRLMASEHTSRYAQTLSRWLAAPRLKADAIGSPAPVILALVQHPDGTVEGRVNQTGEEQPILMYLKRFISECVGITLLSPNEKFVDLMRQLTDGR